jgi:thioesterase domain-containing protein
VSYATTPSQTDVAFLREWLRRNHAAILTPHRIASLRELPLQINGKLDREALLTIAASGERAPMRGPAEAGSEVLTIWRRILQRNELMPDEDFRSAGGDSLMAMEIIMAVEAQFDIRLADEALDTLSTPAAMAEAVAQALTRRRQRTYSAEGDDILRAQRMYISAWAGRAARPDSLVRSLNPGATLGLFWVFQGSAEFTALSNALGPQIALHGMRSGHLIMAYTPETIDLLAEAYATEIMGLQPEGPITIGGNCQGATIARAIAFALRRRGRDISRLILMEMAHFWQYDAPVDLVYGTHSVLNPFQKGADPTADLAAAYRQGFSPHFIRGAHGAFFEPQNVPSLAGLLRGLLTNQEATT